MSIAINMKRYCVYNDVADEWDVSVPITWNGIKKAPMESLGSYQTELEATNAVKAFFIAVNVKPKFGGMMARSEADEQIIKALRIRVASLMASLERERKMKVAPVGTPPPTMKNINEDEDEWNGLCQQSDWGGGNRLGGYLNALNGFDT